MKVVSTNPADHRATQLLQKALNDIDAPGWAVLYGDRKEMAETAISLHYEGIKLIHVAGGETPRGIWTHPDHPTRDAISMLSRAHCVANHWAANCLSDIGIERVHITGLPALDELVHIARMPAPPRDDFALVLIHPHPSDMRRSDRWVVEAGDALLESGCVNAVFVEPNADDGGRILDQLRNLGGLQECMIRRLSLDDFVEHLRRCRLFITNSSSGRIEAPIFGTPVVEIGDRQAGRAPMGTAWHHPEGKACEAIRRVVIDVVKPYPSAFENDV